MNALCECIVAIGLFIIIGTAGSTDINAISLTQALLYIVVGIIIISIGMLGIKGNGGKQRK